MGNIIRYVVRTEREGDATYGKSFDLSPLYESRDKAIAEAKRIAKERKSQGIYVMARHFSSAENLARGFWLSGSVEWNAWFAPDYPDV